MGTGSGVRRAAVALTVGITTIAGLLPAPAGTAGASPRQDDPPPTELAEPLNGQEAVDALGDALPEVAAAHDMTAPELEDELVADETLWVDEGLRLFYVDPIAKPAAIDAAAASIGEAPPFPLGDTFTLHSRPGSNRTIYLDFDGDVRTGIAWNSDVNYGSPTITSTPFDVSGDPGVFDDAERTMIQSVWQRMVEDYAPFDVDITTEAPPLAAIERADGADEQYGTQVVFAGTNPMQAKCFCGGLAYIDIFDWVGNTYYHPAYVYQQGLGGTSTSAKLLAEAGTHEVGHNLSLLHDGTSTLNYYTGHGSWAPIMGTAYTRPFSQWSSGEYTGANRSTQDDLAAIVDTGLPLLADDHGATNGTATPLTGSPVATGSGRITTRTDVDVFSFTAPGGLVTLNALPAPASPNLDISMKLYDGGGALLTTVDPTSGMTTADEATGLSAVHAEHLAAGTYYIHIDGVGALNPANTGYSDYGSLGTYTLSAEFGPCAVDDDLDDDSTSTTRFLVPGQPASGKRCADDDYIRIPTVPGTGVSAQLTAPDGTLDLALLDATGTVLSSDAASPGDPAQLTSVTVGSGDHYFRISGGAGAESRYSLTTSLGTACPPDDGSENDDGVNTPKPLTLPGSRSGVLCDADTNKSDYMLVSLTAGRRLTVDMTYFDDSVPLALDLFNWPASNFAIANGVASNDHRTLTFMPMATGNYQLRVLSFGGTAQYFLTADQEVEPTPTISSLSPSSGLAGTTVTITGTGLAGVNDVDFAGAPNATFTKVSPTQLTTTVPAGATDGPITITNGVGSAQHSFNVLGGTWGTDGTVTRDGPAADVVSAIAPAPDGTVYAAWEDEVAADGVSIVRYDSDGNPDASFGGGDGVVTFDQSVLGHIDDLSVDSLNRLLIIGQWSVGDPILDPMTFEAGDRLFRLEADGDLDATFSDDGIVDFGSIEGSNFSLAYDVRADASNRVLVSGVTSVPVPGSFDSKVFLQRYSAAGALDVSFGGGDGSVLTDLDSNNGSNYTVGEIRVDASNRIYVFASRTTASTQSEIVLLRYTNAGALDSTYNSDGQARYACPGTQAGFVYGGNVLADGRAVFTATCAFSGANGGARSVRLLATGELDTTYGVGGTRRYLTAADTTILFSLEVPVGADGATYLHGFNSQTEYVGRISPNGKIDPAYERVVPHDDGWSTTGALGADGAFFYGYTESGAGKITKIDPVTGEPPNNAPVAVDDSANALDGETTFIDVLANDTDADDDDLFMTADTNGTNGGTVDCVTDSDVCEFTPAPDTTTDTFTYTVSDGIDSDTATVTVTIEEPPVTVGIDSFTPTSGPVGTDVTITGFGFDDAIDVWFGFVSAPWLPVSDTEIVATVPEGAVDGPITVITNSSSAGSAEVFTVTGGNQPPSAGFISPTDFDTVKGIVPLRVAAEDSETSIHRVDLWVDGEPIATVTETDGEGLWTFPWNSAAVGDGQLHQIDAVAYDMDDLASAPASIFVTVSSSTSGDYDGNGTTDIAIYRPGEGRWLVRGQFQRIYGPADAIPVPGDYNGDGTTDIAYYDPTTGRWAIRGQYSATYGGQPGDIPVPGLPPVLQA